MNVFRAAFVFTIMLVILAIGGTLFCLFVPMNFYVDAYGRVEANHFERIQARESGDITFVCNSKEFKKGDLLYSQDCGAEKKRLEIIAQQKVLLTNEIANQKKRIELEKQQYLWDLKSCMLSLERLQMEADMQDKQMDIYKTVSDNLKKQKQLNEELKDKEAKIFSTLYEKHLLPKIEYLKIMYEKSLSEAAAQEIELRAEQWIFDNKIEISRLNAEQKLMQQQKDFYAKKPQSLTSLFDIQYRLLEIEDEILTLQQVIKNKEYRAPFDGIILMLANNKGDYVNANSTIMEIADTEKLKFSAVVNQDIIPDIKEGLPANIYLDNYFFHKFGLMDGKVVDLQVCMGSIISDINKATTATDKTAYLLTVSIDNPIRKFELGLTGKASIVVFNGTVFQYLLKDRF